MAQPSEFESVREPEEEGPPEVLISSKRWQSRARAYAEIEKIFKHAEDEKDPCFAKFREVLDWKSILSETTALPQEAGINLFYMFVDRAKEAVRGATTTIPLLIEKSFAGRPNTTKRAQETLLTFIELEQYEPVFTGLLASTRHKNPKIAVPSVNTLREIIRLFGAQKAFPVKEIAKVAPELLAHSNQQIRDGAKQLVLELYRWLGGAVLERLEQAGLRDTQLKELGELFKTTERATRPERVPRSQQGIAAFMSAAAAVAPAPAAEVFDQTPLVNVLGQLAPDWAQRMVEAKKPQERTAVLDELHQLCQKATRIDPAGAGGGSESGGWNAVILGTVRGLLGDKNVLLASKAVNVLGCLCRGMQADFTRYARDLLPPLLDMLRERSPHVAKAVHPLLDAIYLHCLLPMPEIVDAVAAAADKDGKVRFESTSWLRRALTASGVAPSGGGESCAAAAAAGAADQRHRESIVKALKPLCALLVRCADDADAKVRDEALQALAQLVGLLGERPLIGFINKLDKVKHAKLTSFVPASPAVVAAAATAASVSVLNDDDSTRIVISSKRTSDSNSGLSAEAAPKRAKPTAQSAAAASSSARPSASKSAGAKKTAAPLPSSGVSKPKKTGSAAGKAVSAAAEGPPAVTVTGEQALVALEELLGPAAVQQLAAQGTTGWKEKELALRQAVGVVDAVPEPLAASRTEALLVALACERPSLKDKSVPVVVALLAVLQSVVRRAATVPRACVPLLVMPSLDKLADAKARVPARDLLTALAEATSLRAVSSAAFGVLKDRAPKAVAEALAWFEQSLREFPPAAVDVPQAAAACQQLAAQTNAPVRAAALKVLATLRLVAGDELVVSELPPPLLKSLDAEFAKICDQPRPQPTRTCRDGVVTSAAPAEVVREDIAGKVAQSGLLKKAADPKWQVRKEALDEATELVVAAKRRIAAQSLAPLVAAVRPLLHDANQSVVIAALDFIGLLAASSGSGFGVHAKSLYGPVMAHFAHAKAVVREAAIRCVDTLHKQLGFAPLLPSIASAVESVGQARESALQWMVKHDGAFDEPKIDVALLARPLVASLEDRSKEVRRLAESVLRHVVRLHGADSVRRLLGDLKPASKLVVAPLVEQAIRTAVTVPAQQSTVPTSAAAAAVPAAATTTPQPLPPAAAGPAMTVSASTTLKKPAAPLTLSAVHPVQERGIGLVANRAKDARLKKLPPLPGPNVSVSRDGQLDTEFAALLRTVVRDPMLSLMLSGDWRQQLEATQLLSTALSDAQQWSVITDNLDIICRWLGARLVAEPCSPQVWPRLVDLATSVVIACKARGVSLDDGEGSALLVPLLLRLERDRSRVEPVLQEFSRVYPMSKVLACYSVALKEMKSVAARSAIAEEFGRLIDQEGLSAASSSKAREPLAALVALFAERQADVRRVAGASLHRVYARIGDRDFWKLVAGPGLSEEHREALSQLFAKLQALATVPQPSSSPEHAALLPDITVRDSDVHGAPVADVPAAIEAPADAPFDSVQLESLFSAGDLDGMCDALKELGEHSDRDLCYEYADFIVGLMCQGLHASLDIKHDPSARRYVRYVLTTAKGVLQESQTRAPAQIGTARLHELFGSLLRIEHEVQSLELDQQKPIKLAFRALVTTVMQSAALGRFMATLIQLITESIPKVVPADYTHSSYTMRLTQWVETLAVPSFFNGGHEKLDAPLLLRRMHEFLELHPSTKFATRSDVNFAPHKAMRGILDRLVGWRGEQVQADLGDIASNPGYTICHYIRALLRTRVSVRPPLAEAAVLSAVSEPAESQSLHSFIALVNATGSTADNGALLKAAGAPLTADSDAIENRAPNVAADDQIASIRKRLREKSGQPSTLVDTLVGHAESLSAAPTQPSAPISSAAFREKINRMRQNKDLLG